MHSNAVLDMLDIIGLLKGNVFFLSISLMCMDNGTNWVLGIWHWWLHIKSDKQFFGWVFGILSVDRKIFQF